MLLELSEPLISAIRKRKKKTDHFGKSSWNLPALLSDVQNINITADQSSIVVFSVGHQILTIPQSQLLARAHRVRGKTRQDNLGGKRVISG